MHISTLKYPNKSHRKRVLIPDYSVDLAEFFGIMIGDGGINNDWQANISLNSVSDSEYAIYIAALCEKLFRIRPTSFKTKNKNNLVLKLNSTSIVDFLVAKGLTRGNKLKAGLRIPQWILAESSYKIACVRGLVDTDGCLYIHKHKSKYGKTYINIGLNFSSYSPELISQVSDIFLENNIVPHINNKGNGIYLYKVSAIETYLETFSSSNDRIKSIYQTWRRLIAVY